MKQACENSLYYFLPANQLRRKMCCAKRFRNLERLFHRILARDDLQQETVKKLNRDI